MKATGVLMIVVTAISAAGCATGNSPTSSTAQNVPAVERPAGKVGDSGISPTELLGTWRGTWRNNNDGGTGELHMSVLEGREPTIAATNARRFGPNPQKVELELKGRKVQFSAPGSDGQVFSGDLTLSSDGANLNGLGYYNGNPIGVWLRKQKQ